MSDFEFPLIRYTVTETKTGKEPLKHCLTKDQDEGYYCIYNDVYCALSEQQEKIQQLEAQLKQHEWISVDEADLEDGKHYVASNGESECIAKYWKAIGKWLSSDVRMSHNTEVTHVIPKPITPPQESWES